MAKKQETEKSKTRYIIVAQGVDYENKKEIRLPSHTPYVFEVLRGEHVGDGRYSDEEKILIGDTVYVVKGECINDTENKALKRIDELNRGNIKQLIKDVKKLKKFKDDIKNFYRNA